MSSETRTLQDPNFKLDAVQILRGATWFGVGTGIGMVLEYLTQGLVAAQLGPSDFGALSVGLQVFAFAVALAALALPSAVTYFIPNARAEEGSRRTGQIVSTSLVLTFLTSLLVGGVLFAAAPLIGEGLFREPDLVAVLRLLSLALPSSALVLLVAGILRGLKLSRQASLLTSTFDRALRLGFIVAFLAAGLGLKAPALAYLPASVLVLALGLFQIRRAKVAPQIARPAAGVVGHMFQYSMPLLASQLLLQGKTATQPLLLAFFLDTRSAGLFSVAFLISGAFSMILVAFNFLYLPVVSGLSIEEHKSRIQRLYRMVTGWGVMVAVPIALLIFAMPEAFLRLFGAQYTEGAWALRILLVGALINVGAGSVGTTLLATGKTRTYLKINIIGVGLGFGLSLVLVPTFGLVGAAMGQMLTSALWNGLSLWILYRMYRMQPFSRQYLYVFLVGLTTLLVLLPGILWVLDLSRWAIVAVVPIHLGLTLALLWKLRLLDPETRATIRALLGSLEGRLGTMHPLLGVRK